MRVLIISDTHGRHTGLDRALEEAGDIDLFIHLGDVEGGEEYINAVVDCEKHMVRGNNDFFSDLPREEEFYIGYSWPCILCFPGSGVYYGRGRGAQSGYRYVRAHA